MKSLYCIALAGLSMGISAIGKGQIQQPYTITGTINGAEGKWLYVSYRDGEDSIHVDSALVQNRRFRVSGTIPSTIMVSFYCKNCTPKTSYTRFFLEPTQMQVTGDAGDFEKIALAGSKTQDEYMEYQAKREHIYQDMKPIQARYEANNEVYIAARRRGASIDELDSLGKIGKNINAEFDPYRELLKIEDRKFVKAHPTSIVNAFNIAFFNKSDYQIDSLQSYYDHLGASGQQTIYGISIRNYIIQKRNTDPHPFAKNFVTVDINGKPLQLTDYSGKYVLLDFWASWCIPCREASPHLKKLYAQYQSKGFEVIGVADNDSQEDLWRAAVKKDGLPWRQVLRGYNEKIRHNEKDILGLFDVGSLPTYVLIGPEGKIISRYGGDGEPMEALDGKLAGLMDQQK